MALDQVRADAWMEWFLGLSERELLQGGARGEILNADDGTLVHRTSGERRHVGEFTVPSVAELAAQVEAAGAGAERRGHVPLTAVDGVDVGIAQARLRTEDKAMVQIASNFNCLEVPGRGTAPNYGHLVEGYATDCTQGPGASFGVPAASLWRAHYAFCAPGVAAEEWGQTQERQLELLKDVRQYFGTCQNGKVTLDDSQEPVTQPLLDEVASSIRVGLHADAELVFGRSRDRAPVLDVLPRPWQRVDQVLCASVNWNSPGCRPDHGLDGLTRAALRGAYEGTYLAAVQRGTKHLVLTLIGGGSFRNPQGMILEELVRAHRRWASHPASSLEQVTLWLYERRTAETIQAKLEGLLAL